MGLGRFLWRATGIGHRIDTVKNIVQEGSIVKGVKKTIKEDFCEDNPVTAHIYNVGKFDGKKDGYVQASKEYEAKLLEQADLFLKQTKDFQKERDAYEELLKEYEVAIAELEEKANRTEQENQLLQLLLLKERQLKKLVS